MDVLIRWPCCCLPYRNDDCLICEGKGYIEVWIPYNILDVFKGRWIIYDRRPARANSDMARR
jgi:hypothetical protein